MRKKGLSFSREVWRRMLPLSVAGLVAVIAVVGCRKTEAPPPSGASTSSANKSAATPSDPAMPPLPPRPPDPIDLTQLQNAFASASAALKVSVDETIGSVRARDFADALERFQRLSGNPNLTPEQKQAVDDVIARLKGMTPRR